MYAPSQDPSDSPPNTASYTFRYAGSTAMYGNEAGTAPGAAAYGSMAGPKASPVRRGRVPVSAVLLCMLAPCGIFALCCAALSFQLHKTSPPLMWLTVVCCAVVTLACTFLAALNVYKRMNGEVTREPYWYIVLAASMIIAFVCACYLGEINWWNNLLPYIDLQTLSSRDAVDPSTMAGQQLMDVGRVEFLPGTHLDLARAIGFKNANQYCVAPIVRGNGAPSTGSYDYWAIGLNCCTGASNDFHCGEYNNPNARAGLRIMREDQRAFYRLAVQQAEAAYNIKAQHPIFVYWMQDPHAEMETYRDEAMRTYVLGVMAYCAFQLFAMVVAIFVFTKI